MLLNMKTLLILATLGMGFSAHAANMPNLSVGNYTLVSGNSDLCPNFKIKQKDLTAKHIYLGANQLFLTENSLSSVKSDIDSRCEFKDKSVRADSGALTTLKMINRETCDGKIRSQTTSIATIREKAITLIIQVPGAQTEVCKFRAR